MRPARPRANHLQTGGDLGGGRVHFIPQAAFRRPRHYFGPILGFGERDASAAVGSDAHGDWLTVLSRAERNGSEHGVLATTRRPGGRFTKPSPITQEASYGAATLAVNAAGTAVAAWNANGRDSRVHVSTLR